METAMEVYNETETQPIIKRRKKKSKVWEHFTMETVEPNCRRAVCKGCCKSFAYSNGPKVVGTSHLKRHIAGICPTPSLIHTQENDDNTQLLATPYTPKRRYRRKNNGSFVAFNQDKCRHEIARMIIIQEYPLHMVEDPGFVSFVQMVQPNLDATSVRFKDVQGDCVATYLVEKQNVLKSIEEIPGRFCLTLDFWTSKLSYGYVFLTAHFIDSDWKIQKKLLNVLIQKNLMKL